MSYNFNDAADRLRLAARNMSSLTYAEDAADLLRYAAQIVDGWNEWQDKTAWVQTEASNGTLRAALGKHRADAMRNEVKRLRAENEALRHDAGRAQARLERAQEALNDERSGGPR